MRPAWLVVGVLALATTGARAQEATVTVTPPSVKETPPPADAPKPAADAPKAASGEAGKAPAAGDAPKAGAEGQPKPSPTTGGYSWTDKPHKGGQRRYRQKKIDPKAPIATYPAFRMNSDGTSQVWVQVNKKVTVNSGGGSGLYTYVLTGAQIPTWNNTNPLVTEYFDTPLARARLKNDKNGAQLVLEMRESVQPKHRVVDGPGGTLMLYIDLPKASRTYSTRNEDVSQIGRRNGRVLPSKRGSANAGARAAPRRGPNP